MSSSKKKQVVMLPVQSRMARAATGFQIIEIARRAKVATATIVRFEKGEELKPRTVEAIQRAYEIAGIEFLDGDAPGVRLHTLAQSRRKTLQR